MRSPYARSGTHNACCRDGDRPAIRATGKRAVSPERSATVIHPTPHDMSAFIIGANRVFTRSDVQGHHLWMDDKGVICLSILTTTGAVTYLYTDHATAQEDYDRVNDSDTVTLRGESSEAAYDRIVAVLTATATGQLTEMSVLHGR